MADNFDKILSEKTKEVAAIDKILKEELNISLDDCSKALHDSLYERADELFEDIINLAPYGNYDKMMEDPEEISSFLKDEACDLENWKIDFIELEKKEDKLLKLTFLNKAVDDGDILKGYVFIGLSGKIRHAFCLVHN